jgi:hypothetical protein
MVYIWVAHGGGKRRLNSACGGKNMVVKISIAGVKIGLHKRNPWMKIDPDRCLAKGTQYIEYFKLPPWTGKGSPRPAGIKAVNDIFTYVRKEFAGYTVKDAVEAVGTVMANLPTFKTAADVRAMVSSVKSKMVLRPAVVTKAQRLEEARARATRIPAFQAIAKELGIVA